MDREGGREGGMVERGSYGGQVVLEVSQDLRIAYPTVRCSPPGANASALRAPVEGTRAYS